ncbi:MAG TPA: hypothetical protein ENN66_09760 [Proteobacteria bacterium]|nr:hypothetical protein [Pseudomonadota bacterium]
MKTGATKWIMFLVILGFLVIAGPVTASGIPTVISTIPANGATDIARGLTMVSFTFSEPMSTGSCGSTSSNWGRSSCSWSPDGTILTLNRDAADTLLPAKTTVSITLNGYQNQEGDYLVPYTLTFTTASVDERIEAHPAAGFSWPYFLYVPTTVAEPSVLLVEPNNTGAPSDDPAVHETAASNLLNLRSCFAERLQVPLLVPAFPRPSGSNWQIYTHALDRDSLTTTVSGIERLDLQLIAMINDARQRLAGRGITLEHRVFLNGYSASGSFVNRFALLHPEIIKAVASGSPGGWPTVPAAFWEGQELIYPVGIADLESLVGTPFNLTAFQAIPAFIFIGDADNNDAVPYADGFSDEERQLVYRLFGAPPEYPYVRWPKAEAIYNLETGNGQFYIYPDVGHTYTSLIWEDLERFFSHYRTSTSPLSLKEKPLRYHLYFPHIACAGTWQTEIGITNNLEGLEVNGELRAYSAAGETLGGPRAVTIPAGGRLEVGIANVFVDADEIAYLDFAADSFYLSGYTKFSQPGNRVSIAATTGGFRGVFLKKERQGWTGIAFVNPGDRTATVTLKALSDSGQTIACRILAVPAGAKVVNIAEDLFDDDIGSATFIRYQADSKLIGFVLNGSADNLMLDGLPAAAEWFR